MQEGQPKLLRFTMLDIIEQFSRQKEKKIIKKRTNQNRRTRHLTALASLARYFRPPLSTIKIEDDESKFGNIGHTRQTTESKTCPPNGMRPMGRKPSRVRCRGNRKSSSNRKKKMKQTNRKRNLHYQTRAHRQMNSTDHYFRNLGNRRHSVLYNLEINDVRGEKPLYEQMIRPLSLLPPLSILT